MSHTAPGDAVPGRDGGARPGGPGDATGASTRGPLAALAFIGLVTAAWWALALWPSGASVPVWLERARAVCFNITESGLPDAGGWILLVGQPVGMVGLLLVGWSRPLGEGLRRLAASAVGRAGLVLVVLLTAAGLGAAGVRVATASAAVATPSLPEGVAPSAHPRLGHPAPDARLVDQHGERAGVGDYAGRPLLVTFAFGNCATICPVVVHQAGRAIRELRRRGVEVGLLVVSLDPWRDTPARLPAMAERWELPAGARVVSGTVPEVQAVLDAWKVARERDPRTGDIVHPALTYVVDGDGVVRYATTGRTETLVGLVEREIGR